MKLNSLGFTFVEIIVALGLSAILLPALGQAISFSIRVASQGEKYSQAYNLAQQGMEQMYAKKSQDWNTFTNSVTTTVTAPFTRIITIEDGVRCGFAPTWDICAAGGQSDPDTKKVTVVVTWTETGAAAVASLSGYVTKY